MLIKTLDTIDVTPLLDFYLREQKNLNWSTFQSNIQVGLQYRAGDDPWTSAVGKSKGLELTYTELNPFFKNTIFEELINRYSLKRTRLMLMGPKSCYSMHCDETPRIHIPIITNEQCFFVFKHQAPAHIPLNHVTWVDTRRDHTAINGSDMWRLHLVGIVDHNF